jgi:PEP-CTERM motif
MRLNLRILLFITLLAASVGIGTVGVHASTDCQHLFQLYKKQVTKHLHHKVSPETLARWAAWNKDHPHYRPTKKESMDKIDFVCQVPMDDADVAQDLPPVSLPPLLPSMTDTFTAPSQPNVLVSSVVPVDNPQQPPTGDPQFGPVYYPGPPSVFGGNTPPTPPVSPTPEPASLLLMATGFGLMLGLVFWKQHRSTGLQRQLALV